MNRTQEYDALKYKYDQSQRRLQRLEEMVKLLENQLKEKRDRIAVLERVSNVVLWEREKKRLLETTKNQQEALSADLAQVQEEYANSKDNSRRTIQSLQEQIKKYELMVELELRQSKEDCLKELDKVKQELHVKRTVVARLEKEVVEQQKCFVGVLRGLRVDFRILMQKYVTEESMPSWKNLSSMFDAVYNSCAAGNLSSLRVALPTHYIGLTSDITGSPSMLRKKEMGMETSSSCVSLESFDSSSVAAGIENDGTESVDSDENDDRGSISSLPILAPSANLTSATSNFVIEVKEKLQAHNQHVTHEFNKQGISKANNEVDRISVAPKHMASRQRSNSLGLGSRPVGALVSPLIKKRAMQGAWRSPKSESLQSSSFVSSRTKPNGSPISSKSPLASSSSTDMKQQKKLATRMSQISLNYQEKQEEKTNLSRRKLKAETGSSSVPLPRKSRIKAQSTPQPIDFTTTTVPSLVDKENGILKIKEVLTCFPYLTEEQVCNHFQNFMRYDTNNDYTLDLSELTTAITHVLAHGTVITKQELLDVLEEINSQSLNSVEFYEYLLLSRKCLELSGTSHLLQNKMVMQDHKKIAEMCCLQ